MFAEVWQNRDESKNFGQRHEAELIKEQKRKEIEAEIRLQVTGRLTLDFVFLQEKLLKRPYIKTTNRRS